MQGIIEECAPGVQHLLPFHLVTRDPIWFEVAGSDPLRLDDGDIIVLPHGADHSLTGQPCSPLIPIEELRHAVTGCPRTLNWGGEGETSEALRRFFHCNGTSSIRCSAHSPRCSSSAMTQSARPGSPPRSSAPSTKPSRRAGGAAPIARLTELLFLEVVQRYLEDGDSTGGLGALNDPIVGAALTRFHTEPERPWTLDGLAHEVGASRSMLTERFTEAVGLSPIRYLTSWRMELAAQRLEETNDPTPEIAATTGYDSEVAFNRAFKRHTGEPPAAWCRRHQPPPPSSPPAPSNSGPPRQAPPADAAAPRRRRAF